RNTFCHIWQELDLHCIHSVAIQRSAIMVHNTQREKVVIVGGARTPIGSFGGAFKDVDAYELGAAATVEALKRSGVESDAVGEVVMGCISQVGPDAYNARRVSLAAGLNRSVPAFNVNRLCGSGLQAIWSAAQELLWSPDLE